METRAEAGLTLSSTRLAQTIGEACYEELGSCHGESDYAAEP
jgi:hypothetical protein